MIYEKNNTTAEAMFIDLCDQVDYWKNEAKKWKEIYEDEVKESNRHLNERLEESKKGIGQALLFMMSVKEGEDGSLIIPSENRETLAKSYSK